MKRSRVISVRSRARSSSRSSTSSGGGDVEALDLAIPADALSEPVPEELKIIENGWAEVFDSAGSRDWSAASRSVKEMTAAWKTHRTRSIPKRIEPRMTTALSELVAAIDSHAGDKARQAAIDTAQWTFDLKLRHRPQAEIDLARFDLWLAQLTVDAARRNAAAVNGDFFTLDYIRDRIIHTLDGAEVTRINTQLESLLGAVGDRELGAATRAAERLRRTLHDSSR